MGTTANYLAARNRIDLQRLIDVQARAGAGLMAMRGDREFSKLRQSMQAKPDSPARWYKRAVEREMNTQRVREIYFRLRRSLWQWSEFAGLRPGARAVLEAVIELAREEAFAWYVMVPAQQVRAVARLSEARFSECVRELDCLAITRPARVIVNGTFAARPVHSRVLNQRADEHVGEPVAQWVVRYRRGTPWRANRAAWWLNYDLLCETGRALDCYVVSSATLSAPYQSRDMPMGRIWPGVKGDEQIAALSRMLAQRGPLPPLGFRAALWAWREG